MGYPSGEPSGGTGPGVPRLAPPAQRLMVQGLLGGRPSEHGGPDTVLEGFISKQVDSLKASSEWWDRNPGWIDALSGWVWTR